MVFDYTGKAVVVTGAGSGIGRAAALRFAEEGADVTVADIDAESVDESASQIEAVNASEAGVLSVTADVSDSSDVERMIDRTVDEFGSIDVLFNNAGLSQDQIGRIPMSIDEIPEETWNRLVAVNLNGAYLGAKYAIPYMETQSEGVILNTITAAVLRVNAGMVGYSVSKGGLVTLTEQLAVDHAPDNIRVNAITPGPTETPMFLGGNKDEEVIESIASRVPLGRICEPRDIANAAVFLASEQARMITGVNLPVGGGRVL